MDEPRAARIDERIASLKQAVANIDAAVGSEIDRHQRRLRQLDRKRLYVRARLIDLERRRAVMPGAMGNAGNERST